MELELHQEKLIAQWQAQIQPLAEVLKIVGLKAKYQVLDFADEFTRLAQIIQSLRGFLAANGNYFAEQVTFFAQLDNVTQQWLSDLFRESDISKFQAACTSLHESLNQAAATAPPASHTQEQLISYDGIPDADADNAYLFGVLERNLFPVLFSVA